MKVDLPSPQRTSRVPKKGSPEFCSRVSAGSDDTRTPKERHARGLIWHFSLLVT
ncbi:hypothetical protein DPMN_042784 [Dreissena polymorpha]|uniref:Uncharacterized protein n=1 Tax=Dreissena polymorpha TaxID=45954 RepID=A0A9D4D1K6_DREPO|nr:hypothetical protein DPMN_042784 [Dreissena polymorpha]